MIRNITLVATLCCCGLLPAGDARCELTADAVVADGLETLEIGPDAAAPGPVLMEDGMAIGGAFAVGGASRFSDGVAYVLPLGDVPMGSFTNMPGGAPAWWRARGVTGTNDPCDYAVAVQGQVKWIAQQAAAEFQSSLSSTGGMGVAVSNLVASFTLTNNCLPVTLGQLKNAAKPFFDRLIQVGVVTNYPWSGAPSDYALANVGQVKFLFAFDFERDSDGDGITDSDESGYIRRTSSQWLDTSDATNLLAGLTGSCYDKVWTLPLAYPVTIDGTVHTNITVDLNGLVYLPNPTNSAAVTLWNSSGQNLRTWSGNRGHIAVAAYWSNLAAFTFHTPAPEIRVSAFPADTCTVVEYRNIASGYGGNSNECATFQIVLPQMPSNTVYVNYLSASDGMRGKNATVGVQDSDRRMFDATNLYYNLTWSYNPPTNTVTPPMSLEYRIGCGTDPQNPDSDEDGLMDGDEIYTWATNPLIPDTDGDGLFDGTEADNGLNPLSADSDGDLIPDGWEWHHGLNPGVDDAALDPDGDQLGNLSEYRAGTDPQLADTDNDGIWDGEEVGGARVEHGQAFFFDVSGGTNLLSSGAAWYSQYFTVVLPFPVTLAGVTSTNAFISIDGTIGLLDPSRPNLDIPSGSNRDLTANRISMGHTCVAAYWDDLYALTNTLGSRLILADVTTNGSRYCVLEYRNFGISGGGTNGLLTFQFAIPHDEAGRVSVRYLDMRGIADGRGATLGAQAYRPEQNFPVFYNQQGAVSTGDVITYRFGTDPLDADPDGDGLTDPEELEARTNPFNPDTDGDLMSDPWEIWFGFNALIWNNPNTDSDGDGLTDSREAAVYEIVRPEPLLASAPQSLSLGIMSRPLAGVPDAGWSLVGLSPFLSDSDFDGVLDAYDLDPADASDNRVANDGVTVPVTLTVGDSSASHSEMYALSVGPYNVYMTHVNSSMYMFSQTFRLPCGQTFEGRLISLPDTDDDGDYSASVSGPGISISLSDADHGFNSGSIPFTVTTPAASGVSDAAAQPASRDPEDADQADPVNVISGNVTLSLMDAAVNGPGLPLAFERHYNSSTLTGGSPLGPGWTHGYEIRLGAEEETVYKGASGIFRRLYLPDGRTLAFLKSGDAFASADDSDLRLEPAGQGGWTVCRPGGAGWTFDAFGRLASVGDGKGNGAALTYASDAETGAEYLTRVEHTNGQFLSLAYTNAGPRGVFLAGVATADPSWSVAYAYDASGRLASATRVTVRDGAFGEAYRYETVGFCLTQRVDAAGASYNYAYSTCTNNGVVQRVGAASWLDGNAFLTRFLYHAGGVTNATRAAAHRSAGSAVTNLFRWDTRVWQITNEVNEADGSGIFYAYDAGQNPVREAVYHGGVTSVVTRVFDDRHNVLREAAALRAEPGLADGTQFREWHPTLALPVMAADAAGVTNRFAWSDSGLLLAAWDAASSVSLAYTSNGLPAAVTNANGSVTAFAYDANGRPSLTTPPAGPASRTVFDSYGHLVEAALPAPGGGWRATSYTNDTYGRVAAVTWPDGLSERLFRRADGAVTSAVDRAGNRTGYTHLASRTPATVTRWLDATTAVSVAWSRDLQMNTLAVTDPAGRKVESYRLDAQDRVTAVTNLEAQTMTVSYLVGGLVSSARRFDGVTVSNVYDRAGRVTRTLHNGAQTAGCAWRANGQPLAASNATAMVSWGYDPAGRATCETQKVAGTAFAPVNLTCAYDPAGNVTNSHVSVGSSAFGVRRSFDPADRLSSQITPAGSFTNVYCDWNGAVDVVSNAALTTLYAYDVLDQVTNIVYRNASATVVGSFAYRYDALGLVTQKISAVGQASPPVTNAYAYDNLGRLTNAISWSGSGASTNRFTYDLAGNRLSAGASTFTYANNRLNGALHDNAGNITNQVRGTVTLALSWNTLGQLVSVATNRVLAESYAYDPLGRRVKTTTGGVTVYHVYDGDECVADLDSAGVPLRTYTWGLGIDNLLAITVYSAGATNSYYAVKDHLGSVRALVNAAGEIAESYTFDAWGNVLSGQSAIGNRYLWQGREYSFVTGLYNFRARWYAPTIGRWLSKDPIGLEGGLNLYVFCDDDPVNMTDPWGLIIQVRDPNDRQEVLNTLSKFVRGELSFNDNGSLSRKQSDEDCSVEKGIDDVISSPSTYIIDPHRNNETGRAGEFVPFSWDKNVGALSYVAGEGGIIHYDPTGGGEPYNVGFLKKNATHTGASILAHELLGRAVLDSRKVPVGEPGTKTRRTLNAQAVTLANPAFIRMGLPPRSRY